MEEKGLINRLVNRMHPLCDSSGNVVGVLRETVDQWTLALFLPLRFPHSENNAQKRGKGNTLQKQGS
jgi:hypothetical protein